MGTDMLCHNERHLFCWSVSQPSFYIYEVGQRSFKYHIWAKQWSHCAISDEVHSQIEYKIVLNCGYPMSTRNGMLCYNERHWLMIKCIIPFIRWMERPIEASGSIYEPFIVHAVLFLPMSILNFCTKYQILGTLSAQEMGWCAASRDIHCCWSIS